jgi:NADH dehydrogenase FAD-containing subunit
LTCLFTFAPFSPLKFNRKANYLEAAAQSVDPKARTITCHGILCDETCEIAEFIIEYDQLVIAVGAKINTFGIPGVEENCCYLKQIDDALTIRRKITNLFEKANYPGMSEKQIEKLLTFAIIGAGPTGVEFAGELRDFIEEDGPKYWPHLLKHVRIKLIEAGNVVLRPFDQNLQEAAIESLTRPSKGDLSSYFTQQLTEIFLDKKVMEVTEDDICLGDGSKIPYGLVPINDKNMLNAT